MKVNSKILSIPPYISSSWENISSLHIEDKEDKKLLVINLIQGARLEIPGLTTSTLLQIFQSHEQYLEEAQKNREQKKEGGQKSLSLGIPLALNGQQFEQLMEFLQDPSKINSLELPSNLLEKISEAAKMMGLDEKWLESSNELLDHPLYEQLKKNLLNINSTDKTEELIEEEVRDEDLRFKEWDILQVANQLYKVINPLDKNEEYQVFLGKPIGCTCGHDHCEHIKAVLSS